jgi:cytochrome c biogenesis protein CcmG, thiol:disulfide interchange protein DsbE
MRMKICHAILLSVLLMSWVGCGVRAKPPDQAPVKAAVGVPLAIPRLELLDGSYRTPAEPGQGAVLLAFWATWCKYCKAEVPNLNRLYRNRPQSGMEIIGVNAGESVRRIKAFLEEESLEYPIALDREQTLMKRLGIETLPAMVIVDRKGVIRYIGNHLPDNSAALERLLVD